MQLSISASLNFDCCPTQTSLNFEFVPAFGSDAEPTVRNPHNIVMVGTANSQYYKKVSLTACTSNLGTAVASCLDVSLANEKQK